MEYKKIDKRGRFRIQFDPQIWPGNKEPGEWNVLDVSRDSFVVAAGGLDLLLMHTDYLWAEEVGA